MRFRLTIVTAALLTVSTSGANAAPLDEWCAEVKQPSSIALCSDPELRRLAIERQRAFDEARARMGEARANQLLEDQKGWVASYPKACGIAPNVPPPLPLAPEIRDCMAQAGRARIAYLRSYGGAAPAGEPPSASPSRVPPTGAPAAGNSPSTPATIVAPPLDTPSPAALIKGRGDGAPTPSPTTAVTPNCPDRSAQHQEMRAALIREERELNQYSPSGPGNAFYNYLREREARREAHNQAAYRLRAEEKEDAECLERAQKEREIQERDASARQAAAQAEKALELRRQQAAAAQAQRQHEMDEDLQRGYKTVSFEDFVLDGKQMAKEGTKISVVGQYVKVGNIELIFPSQMAAIMTNQGASDSPKIPLLTEDSPRDLRAYFLRCNSSPAAQLGCWARVRGYVTTCEQTTLWRSDAVPCLAVDGGWYAKK